MTTSEFNLSVMRVGGVALVRAEGVLDLSTYARFRDGLLKCAADEPIGLVVELDWDLEIANASVVSVFSTVWMRVSEWPGVPVLLVAIRSRHRDLLVHSGVGRFVPYFSSLQTALDAIDEPPYRRMDRMSLPPTTASVAQARDFVRRTCLRWDLAPIADDAAAVAAELVDNAVRHTVSGPAVRLELRRDKLTIAVKDTEPSPPVAEANGTHGLDVVEALSRIWGSSPNSSGGKTVWAVLDTVQDSGP